MYRGGFSSAKLMHIVHRSRDGAVPKQHNAVRDADWDDLGIGCASECLGELRLFAGQYTQCAGAMTEIVLDTS